MTRSLSNALLDSDALPSGCSTRQSPKYTRQRLCRVPHSAMATRKKMAGKAAFAESHLSGTRQSFCRVPSQPPAKKTAQETVTAALPSANPNGTRQSFSFFLNSLPSAARAGTRQSFLFLFFLKFFAERRPRWHSVKLFIFIF